MAEENEYKANTSIYNGVPIGSPEQEARKKAEQRARRANLPKFELKEGKELYISRDTIRKLNIEYFKILDELKRGLNSMSFEDLESYMRSVLLASYQSEIAQLQRDAYEKAIPLQIIRKNKNIELKADYVKDHWWQRKSHPNDAMQQLLDLASIEAAMEFAARAAEIERQREFIDGAEPDAVTEFFYLLADEFIPARKRKRFIDKQYERVSRLLTEYAQAEAVDRLYSILLNELARKRKREKFEEQNGEYLKILIKDFIQKYIEEIAALTPEEAPANEAEPPAPSEEGQPEQAAESEEPEEPDEDEEDDLSALYELADEPDVEEPAAPGEVQEHAEQAATASEEAPEQVNDVADDVEQMQMLMPQSEGSAEPEEPDTGANADKGEETENTD